MKLILCVKFFCQTKVDAAVHGRGRLTLTCGQIRINSTCNCRTTKFAPSVVLGSYMNHDEGRPQLQTVPAFFGPRRVENLPVFY